MGSYFQRRDLLLLIGAVLGAAGSEGATVDLLTPFGAISCFLDLGRAPISAGAFLACLTAGAYNGGRFTRVVRPDNDHGSPVISVIEGGARPGQYPPVAHETTKTTGLRHLDGTISLSRDAPGTATGGEFFMCIGDQPGLDFGGMRNKDGQGFAAFGRVTRGMEVVRRVWSLPSDGPSPDAYTKGQILAVPVPILSASTARG
jgi:peptidyl-prolyl cis-trans isomerase A (cyclophilin A)